MVDKAIFSQVGGLGHSDNWGGPEGIGGIIHRRHGEGEGGVSLVFCCSARDKPEGLGLLGEQREPISGNPIVSG